MGAFIHLRVHSSYSLLEGALPVKALPKLCKETQMPALAVTDSNNLFGALEISEALAKAGVQPVPACQIDMHFASPQPHERSEPAPAPVVLLAQSEEGYSNLMALVTRASFAAENGVIATGWDDLAEYNAGLICLSGGAHGPAGVLVQQGKRDEAEALLDSLLSIFQDRFYVELQRHGSSEAHPRTPEEELTEQVFVEWAYSAQVPLVATNDVYFPGPDMYEAHDALICIAEGRYLSEDDRRRLTPEHYFKSPEQMAQVFADLPEAIASTLEIARRCAFRPLTCEPILPRFADNEIEELRTQAREGLEARLAKLPREIDRDAYNQRLDYELGVIEQMGFPGYFLIVADFIRWARARGIPVGPGRGSGAGSLVAWALTITNLDPIRYGLLFERFLNPERVSMPDFDIDFCQDRRDEVIAYVQQRYGASQVAQIITFGKLQARAALRDVGRVLQLPYGMVDRISKMVPNNPANPVSLAQAIEEEPRLTEEARKEDSVEQMLNIAKQIEGLYRHASTHAAGVVIGDRPLEQLAPLYKDPRNSLPLTQFNMKWVEQAGLVKFDFLGLKTLTVLQGAVDLLATRGIEIDLEAIPLDDEKAYALYSTADTVGVFQVEGTGMRDALRQLRPSSIEDIIALVALYRPGPMENIPKYCHTKHGREKPDYLHPMLEPILRETYGIIVYQEQVMQIAQTMAGYSLGNADLLRRAMGKKIKAAMDEERPKFLAGAAQNGVDNAKAEEVWDLLEKFANYGFNKSHAAAYALVSYQTAWLKANYPVEFYCAAMNLDMGSTDKLAIYKQELEKKNIRLLPPDVNASNVAFCVEDGAVRYALGAVKNVGADAMTALVEERTRDGKFTSPFDLSVRLGGGTLNRRMVENLIRAGAFDCLEANRNALFQSVPTLLSHGQLVYGEKQSAQTSLFDTASEPLKAPPLAPARDWNQSDRLMQEYEAIGFYVSGHPLDADLPAMARKRIQTRRQIAERVISGKHEIRMAGVVMGIQERKSQRGNRFAFVQLSDPSGSFEMSVFSEQLSAHRDLLQPGTRLSLHLEAERVEDNLRFRLLAAQPLDTALADAADQGLRIHISETAAIAYLEQILTPSPEVKKESGPVNIVLRAKEHYEVEIGLPGAYLMSSALRQELATAPGVVHVEAL